MCRFIWCQVNDVDEKKSTTEVVKKYKSNYKLTYTDVGFVFVLCLCL